ncbi:cysteine-rich CWC family protein [Bradyrhizobium sp. SYSU BS000235]|uniref:cysteine-rich CWC family protein n=1 Tax=Bradyrhizobium sp. SYSU BS000235 TaxID=3411332 RepID=UPI003C768AF3
MIDRSDTQLQPRALNCARCGAAFTCDLSGHCWCADETAKLPMPTRGEDCLCRECLRAEAARHANGT